MAERPQEGQGPQRPDAISVGSSDDSVVRIQLAARWAERFSPDEGDSLRAVLDRFRTAYDYLDAVTHGMEPPSFSQDGAAAEPVAAEPAAVQPPSYQQPQ